jgi:uncharacterized protein YjbI with pentapeptide repeats
MNREEILNCIKECRDKGERINLQGADLSYADLEGVDLSYANLEGANIKRAYFRDADLKDSNLKGADLEGAYLRDANLEGAYLRDADLKEANLRGANLQGAYLSYADLEGADLSYTDLQGANLEGADLSYADLKGATLSKAKLAGANLRRANLEGADLEGADLEGAKLPNFSIVPEEGSFIIFKKVKIGSMDNAILKLKVYTKSKRVSSLIGRKIRVERARVLQAYNLDGSIIKDKDIIYSSYHGYNLTYKVGQKVKADKFNDDIRIECAHGIHGFLTFKEAKEY